MFSSITLSFKGNKDRVRRECSLSKGLLYIPALRLTVGNRGNHASDGDFNVADVIVVTSPQKVDRAPWYPRLNVCERNRCDSFLPHQIYNAEKSRQSVPQIEGEGGDSPKGLGSDAHKPLMRRRRLFNPRRVLLSEAHFNRSVGKGLIREAHILQTPVRIRTLQPRPSMVLKVDSPTETGGRAASMANRAVRVRIGHQFGQ